MYFYPDFFNSPEASVFALPIWIPIDVACGAVAFHLIAPKGSFLVFGGSVVASFLGAACLLRDSECPAKEDERENAGERSSDRE